MSKSHHNQPMVYVPLLCTGLSGEEGLSLSPPRWPVRMFRETILFILICFQFHSVELLTETECNYMQWPQLVCNGETLIGRNTYTNRGLLWNRLFNLNNCKNSIGSKQIFSYGIRFFWKFDAVEDDVTYHGSNRFEES